MKKIAPDKWKHFFVGIVLGVFLQAFAMRVLPFSILWTTIAAFIILFFVCYGFELFSLLTGIGHYEFMDAIAGTTGGLVGMAVTLFVY